MHHAPAVSYPVGRCAFQGHLLLLLGVTGLAVQALWWQQAAPFGGLEGGALLGALLAPLVAATAWWRAPVGHLQWDGAAWRWQAAGQAECAGQAQVRLDWQAGLLLMFRPEGGGAARWLWLERGADARQWDALRRAAHAGHGAISP